MAAGGVARMSGQPRTAGDELRFALAGPAVTAAVAGLFGALALALPPPRRPPSPHWLAYQAESTCSSSASTWSPAFPLDGGRAARALLWHRSGDITSATETAARLGRGFGYGLVALGVLLALEGAPGGLWFALIGVFLVTAAGAELTQQRVVSVLTGIPAERLMSRPPVSIPAQTTLDAAEVYFPRYRFTAFPVMDSAGRAVGMLRIDQLEHIPSGRRAITPVAEVMNRDAALLIRASTDVGHLLELPSFTEFGRAVVVDDDVHPVGVLSLTDVQRALRASQLHRSASAPEPPARAGSHRARDRASRAPPRAGVSTGPEAPGAVARRGSARPRAPAQRAARPRSAPLPAPPAGSARGAMTAAELPPSADSGGGSGTVIRSTAGSRAPIRLDQDSSSDALLLDVTREQLKPAGAVEHRRAVAPQGCLRGRIVPGPPRVRGLGPNARLLAQQRLALAVKQLGAAPRRSPAARPARCGRLYPAESAAPCRGMVGSERPAWPG